MSKLRLHVRLRPALSPYSEWTFDHPSRVTIGFSPAAAIWLFDPNAGPHTELFARQGRELRLRVGPKLEGTLQIEKQTVSLKALRDAGLMKSDSHGDFIEVREKTSGKIVLGSTAIEFWVDPVPKEPEFPLHPTPVRLLRNIPKFFVAMLLLSVVIHYGIHEWVKHMPPPAEPTLDQVSRQFARLVIPHKSYIEQRVQQMEQALGEGGSGESGGGGKRMPPPSSMGGFLAAVSRQRSHSAASPFSSLFSTDALGKSLDQMLKGRSLEDAISTQLKYGRGGSGGPGGGGAGGGSPSTVGIGELRAGGGKQVALEKSVEGPSVARLSVDISETGGAVDPSQLQDLLNASAGQLRDCYERALTRRPDLVGKLMVALDLQPDGRATNLNVSSGESSLRDPGLERCVLDRLAGLTFPRPRGTVKRLKFPLIFSGATRG